MNIDKFLEFWSHHNVSIIETLIGTVLLISIYVAWKSLFAKDAKHAAGETVSIDTTQIEQTLQKILENQSHAAPATAPAATVDLSTIVAPADGGEASAEIMAKVAAAQAEIQRLTSEVESKNQKVSQLEQQVVEAEKKAAAAASSGSAPAAAPAAGVDTSELEAKIRDLQSRLEEYEIISEDIADISKYKEENTQLKAEVERLKEQLANAGSGGGIPVDPSLDIPSDVAALMEQPAVVEEVVAEAPTPSDAPADVTPEPVAAVDAAGDAAALEEMAKEMAAPVAEAAVEVAPAVDVLSDDLMAEFEAAVAQQQSGELKNEAEATPNEAPEAKSEVVAAKDANGLQETEELIGEFENFIKKS